MGIVGFVFMCIASAGVLWALWISFDTEGGSIGQIPVLAYAVGLPLMQFLGLAIFDRAHPQWEVHWWVYIAGFPIAVILVGWLIYVAGKFGARYHKNRGRKLTTG